MAIHKSNSHVKKFKGTIMQIEKPLISGRLRVSKVY